MEMTPKEIAGKYSDIAATDLPYDLDLAEIRALARAYVTLTEPVMVTCLICEGNPDWGKTEHLPSPECPCCQGIGSVPHPEIAELHARFEAASHEESCLSFRSDENGCFVCLDMCDCWKSTFGLDAVISLLTAAENRAKAAEEELKFYADEFVVANETVQSYNRKTVDLMVSLNAAEAALAAERGNRERQWRVNAEAHCEFPCIDPAMSEKDAREIAASWRLRGLMECEIHIQYRDVGPWIDAARASVPEQEKP